MTIAEKTIMDPQVVIDAAEAMAPTIAERAPEIEAARRLPRDLLDRLIDAGCFRFLVPPSHGGLGADMGQAMQLFEALARADGSTGWTVMIGAGSWCDLSGLPRPSFDALFANGPDVIVAGAFNPSGRITPTDEGYVVSGRWAFASGCEHADWLWGNCVEGFDENGPQLRLAVFSPDQVVIEDTWNVAGLRGTGSHHFNVDDVVVDASRTSRVLVDEPCIDAPIVRVPAPSLYALVIASVALGIAQGALDDVVALARDKVPLLAHGALATDPVFQLDLATAETDVRAARALLHETTDDVWSAAVDGRELTVEQRARARAAAVWATERAAGVTAAAYRLGGGSALYADSALQRRLRDINALTQHFLVKRGTLVTAGAILAGNEVELTVF